MMTVEQRKGRRRRRRRRRKMDDGIFQKRHCLSLRGLADGNKNKLKVDRFRLRKKFIQCG